MTRIILALLLGSLLACRPAGDAARTGETMAEAGAPTSGPTGPDGDPVAPEVKNGAVSALPVEATAGSIPEQFRGRWGLVPADCAGGADAKGLLLVEADRLTFYESRATLDSVLAGSRPEAFAGRFDFTGEGMNWAREVELERQGAGLRRVERGGEEGTVDLLYRRCPA
jgi:hypothetical protein